jgi:carbonic anhydrase/acetyltransferase-like protein (isoleucine patch superfamily)
MPLYSIDGIAPELPPDGAYYIAPGAILIGRIRLLRNASIWFGAVLRGDNDWITVGEESNVQDNAVIHADAGQPVVLGRGVTVGHHAIVHSATVGDHSLIGMGATLLNRSRVGSYCVIGAGALVPEDREFADGSLAVGAPARLVRKLDEEQRNKLEYAAQIYVANGKKYRDGLAEIRL